jgi:hypothetical protein
MGRRNRKGNGFDFEELNNFKNKLDKLESSEKEKIMVMAIKRVASRFLREVLKITPVGNYTDGRVGGTLRRGWVSNGQRTAELSATFGGDNDFNGALGRVKVRKRGNTYIIEIENVVEYASYVNNGHRTRNGGWVEGQFFMEIAADKIEGKKDKDVEAVVIKYLKEALE